MVPRRGNLFLQSYELQKHAMRGLWELAMGPEKMPLEKLRLKKRELDDLLDRKESECRDIRYQRNALACVIAMMADDDGMAPMTKDQG